MVNFEFKTLSLTAHPSATRALLALLGRELRVEWRTKALTTSMGLFALLCVVIVGLAVRGLPTTETYHRFVLGMLWVCTMFTAVVGLNRAATADRHNNLFQALLLAPYDPALLFVTRLISALAFLLATQVLLVAAAVPMLKFPLTTEPALLGIVLLTDLGILAPGVLLSSTTARVRGGEALLMVALLPIVVPVFLGALGATDAYQAGTGFAGARPYLLLLGVCDAIFLALGLLLFGKLNEG